MPTTVRGQLPTPAGGVANNIPADMQALADQVAATFGLWLPTDDFADIPAADAEYDRALIYVSDARALFRCDGATWTPVPTIESMTTVQRDGLVAGGKWNGRVIFNTTTAQHEQWSGAAWSTFGGSSTFYRSFLIGG